MSKIAYLTLVAAALASAQTVTINPYPTREFGQPKLPLPTPATAFQLDSFNENFVEGRELDHPNGVAVDLSSSPPILYVADSINNRVLAWKVTGALSKGNYADKVIGQRSFTATNSQGPGSGGLSSGLSAPVAVAVDSKGNLYVADSGNNRILRYPAPFSQTGDLLTVDLVIGQQTLSSGKSPNEGGQGPSAKTLFLSSGGQLFSTQIAFDAQGNLWIADAGNNRVLRFPVSQLTANTQEPQADIVIGQANFTTGTYNYTGAGPRTKDRLFQPAGIAFDQVGRLYVVDSYYPRILVYNNPPFATGISAGRVLGIPLTPTGQNVFPYPTQYTVGLVGNTGSLTPAGLFTIGNNLFVCDTPANRVVKYDVPESWPAESDTAFSPPQIAVYGQPDFTSSKVNHNATDPDSLSFASPVAGAVNGTEVLIADENNNRVLSLPLSGGNLTAATRVLGQLDFNYNASNLVEGRELFIRSGSTFGGGVVIDRSSDPPHMYVADTFNNRVLGFKDARNIGTDFRSILTQKADIVIGQQDLFHVNPNSPNSDSTKPTDSGLVIPTGLAVDSAGNLFVADTGNGRVLRFATPFSQPPGLQHANLVLGQLGFTSTIRDASSVSMSAPWGLAILSDGSVAASDAVHNRVLLFRKPAGGDFSNGQAASIVLGQPDFSSTAPALSTQTSPASNAGLNGPRNIAADSSDRLYVTDIGNNRLLVFTRVLNASSGATSALQVTGLNAPLGVAVSQNTGEIWVANTNSNQLLRYPEFNTLLLNTSSPTATLTSNVPSVVALDSFDNLIAIEGSNRMTFYFAALTFRHAASFNQQPLAPGMLAYLARVDGKSLNTSEGSAPSVPWPTTLSNYQVQVNGVAAPIFHVLASAGRIDMQIPTKDASGNPMPTSGTVDFVVTNVQTGQVIASGNFPMAPASPGFFTINQQGTGQVAALNGDGSVNSASNAVGRSQYISLFLTGQGLLPNAPADGAGAAGAVPTPETPVVILQPGPPTPLPASNIQYSGLAPGLPGLWQINVQVPDSVPPNANVVVVVSLADTPSNIGPTGRIVTTIAVK